MPIKKTKKQICKRKTNNNLFYIQHLIKLYFTSLKINFTEEQQNLNKKKKPKIIWNKIKQKNKTEIYINKRLGIFSLNTIWVKIIF